MDQNEILNKMQDQVRLLHAALEQYKYQFDLETLSRISEPLSVVTQNIMEIDKELQLLKHLTNNPQIKGDQT